MSFIDTKEIFSPIDVRDYKLKTDQTDFPVTYELDDLPAKDQGSVGSCVAHSVAELVEYINRWQEGGYIKMSTGYIYGNREYETTKLNHGYYIRLAMKVLKNRGVCPWKSFPYNVEMPEAEKLYLNRDTKIDKEAYANRISSYFRITDKNAAKSLIMNGFPVVCSLYWDNMVCYDKEHILCFPNGNKAKSGHCVIIVGWNENGWIIQNSWGKNWGKSGRATIPYDAPIKELWGVTDEIVNSNLTIKKTGRMSALLQKAICLVKKFFKRFLRNA